MPHTLPPQSTSFVGRSQEIAQITRLLHESPSRLLTLVGPGGIGKTRLAVHVAAREEDRFPDGIFFVELQSLCENDLIESAIARAVNLSLTGQDPPAEQLFAYLRDRQALLVLDNFEHLLDAAIHLPDLLRAAPKVRLLVTSREVLNLSEEWAYHVHGLPLPEPDEPPGATPETAAALFLERAHQFRPDFNARDEWPHIVRICRLVEGMPLGLELAATWTRIMSCAQIVEEMERNIDFLVTRIRNVPGRHHSIRAVFEQSWQLLSPEEQTAFRRLSIFRAGFRREAAELVAGASLVTISALVDKSLLRIGPDERYQIHELLRQYGWFYLEQDPAESEAVQAAHRTYYANYLEQRHPDLLGEQHRRAVKEISAELNNIRLAWQSMLEHADVSSIRRSIYILDDFWQQKGLFAEGLEECEKAVAVLQSLEQNEEVLATMADILVDMSWFYVRQGRLDEADAVAREAQALFEQIHGYPAPGPGSAPLIVFSITASIRGHYEEAIAFAEQALAESEGRGDDENVSMSHYVMCGAWLALGVYEEARQHAQLAYETARRFNRWWIAYCLIERGNVARAMGDYEAADRFYRESYDIRAALDNPEGMALSLYYLGKVAFLREDYEQAHNYFSQSLKLYANLADPGGRASVLEGLGRTAGATGDYAAARRCLLDALEVTLNAQLLPRLLSVLSCLGELLLSIGRADQGTELVVLALYHPATDQETKKQAQQCLKRHGIDPVAAGEGVYPEAADIFALAHTARIQINQLALPDAPRTDGNSDPNRLLLDPLTEREREVLALIAAGLSNREIADRLVITVGTVKAYANHIYSKLGVGSRTQAIVRARELHLI